jgi:hypothetical protein
VVSFPQVFPQKQFCDRHPLVARLKAAILFTPSVSIISFTEHTGEQKPFRSVPFVLLLSPSQQLTARSQTSLPLSRKVGNPHVKITLPTNEHLRTAAHSYTRKRIQTLFGSEACQKSSHVFCLPYVTHARQSHPCLSPEYFVQSIS